MYTFKQLRKHHKLSQSEMAKRLGFESQAFISNMESGKRNISAQMAYTIMKEFDVIAHVVMKSGEWSFTPKNEWVQP